MEIPSADNYLSRIMNLQLYSYDKESYEKQLKKVSKILNTWTSTNILIEIEGKVNEKLIELLEGKGYYVTIDNRFIGRNYLRISVFPF
jgi:translation initiation factor 1 (eIF-1/SUI1)